MFDLKRFFIFFFLLVLPASFFAVNMDIQNGKQEVFSKKQAKPVIIRVKDLPYQSSQTYLLKIQSFDSKMGHFSKDSYQIDSSGAVRLRFTAGNGMGKLPVRFSVVSSQGKIIIDGKFDFLILNLSRIIFTVLGGLAIFLFGIKTMSEGLQAVAGDKMKAILGFLTKNRLMGVVLGFSVTALIQSSSATTVMVVGFINAGLMDLVQSVGIIMGANIGTTITAQLIAFNIKELALPAIALGFILIMVSSKRRSLRFWGEVVFGFGMLFLGMHMMSEILKPLSASKSVTDLFVNFSRNPFLGLLAGILATVTIQSSSATVGLTMALAGSGLIDIAGMFPIILGDNIGTTITAQLAALNANRTAKQAAWVHSLFNLFGSLLMLAFILIFKDKNGISYYYHVIEALTPGKLVLAGGRLSFVNGNVERFVANSHTLFNLTATMIFLPLGGALAKAAEWLIPSKKEESSLEFLEPHLIETPALALDMSKKELLRMLGLSEKMMKKSISALLNQEYKKSKDIPEIEDLVDKIQYEVTQYLLEIDPELLQLNLSNQIPKLIHTANDIERIGDLSENLYHLALKQKKSGFIFSKQELKHLAKLVDSLEKMIQMVIELIPREDKNAFRDVLKYEDKVNGLYKKIKVSYLEKVAFTKQKGDVSTHLVYIDSLNYLEKIGDHLTNITEAFIHLEDDLLDAQ